MSEIKELLNRVEEECKRFKQVYTSDSTLESVEKGMTPILEAVGAYLREDDRIHPHGAFGPRFLAVATLNPPPGTPGAGIPLVVSISHEGQWYLVLGAEGVLDIQMTPEGVKIRKEAPPSRPINIADIMQAAHISCIDIVGAIEKSVNLQYVNEVAHESPFSTSHTVAQA